MAVVLVALMSIFYACTKEENDNPSKLQKFEEINRISSEMADFHTFFMKKFLTETYTKNDALDQKTVEKLVTSIETEMRNYDFKSLLSD